MKTAYPENENSVSGGTKFIDTDPWDLASPQKSNSVPAKTKQEQLAGGSHQQVYTQSQC
jgi:hypothetical protein